MLILKSLMMILAIGTCSRNTVINTYSNIGLFILEIVNGQMIPRIGTQKDAYNKGRRILRLILER
jgi:hypothetical protein